MSTARLGIVLIDRAQTATAGSTDWQQITGCQGTITLPGGPKSKVDITTHDGMAAGGLKRSYRGGIADTRDVAWTLLLDPDDSIHKALIADYEAGTERDYRIRFYDNVTETWQCRASVGDFSPSGEMEGKLMAGFALFVNTVDYDFT